MGLDGVEVNSEQHIQLTFMECFTSCVLTYVNSRGYDYRRVLLDYWNLSYQYRTLLSSKDARQLPLKYLYGIEIAFVNGNPEALMRSVRDGYSIIMFCSASKLAYFPSEYLGMESSGFQHSILIYGWDERQGHYLVADPTVNATARMRPDEMLAASSVRVDREELHYFTLTEPLTSFLQPDLKSCLHDCSARMLDLYDNHNKPRMDSEVAEADRDERKKQIWQQWFRNRNGGRRALEAFAADVVQSAEWTFEKRSGWIKRNARMMASIKRIRKLIWTTYGEMAAFERTVLEEGQRRFGAVIAMWNSASLLLLKLNGKQTDTDTLLAIVRHIEKLKDVERQFLVWLHETVKRGGNRMKTSFDERLIKVVLRNVRIEASAADIDSETDLVNDLALDSLLIVNLFADLEEEFNIRINVQEISVPILNKYQLLKDFVLEKTK